MNSKTRPKFDGEESPSDSIMDDFQLPSGLRKQLEYPAQQKKRQLAIKHAEQKIIDHLATVNFRLKQDKTKVSIQRSGDSFVLQATLPLKPGEISKDGKSSKQTKISLGIPFNIDGLKTAAEEARELGKLIARKNFAWSEKYLKPKSPDSEIIKSIGALLEEFKYKYFSTRRKSRQSKSTFCLYEQQIARFTDLEFVAA